MCFQGFEAHRWVDLVEIYPLDPSNSFAFDLWENPFAHARTNITAGKPASGIGNSRYVEMFGCGPQVAAAGCTISARADWTAF